MTGWRQMRSTRTSHPPLLPFDASATHNSAASPSSSKQDSENDQDKDRDGDWRDRGKSSCRFCRKWKTQYMSRSVHRLVIEKRTPSRDELVEGWANAVFPLQFFSRFLVFSLSLNFVPRGSRSALSLIPPFRSHFPSRDHFIFSPIRVFAVNRARHFSRTGSFSLLCLLLRSSLLLFLCFHFAHIDSVSILSGLAVLRS